MRTRIKICGLTRPADAIAAVAAGVDAIGLNFYPPSSRFLSLDQAAEIVAVIPAFVDVVAVVVDPQLDVLESIVKTIRADIIQFHGDESADVCRSFAASVGRPYIKSISMRSDTDLLTRAGEYSHAGAILVDTFDAELIGGSGKTFAWEILPEVVDFPLILAGGLTVQNVAHAVREIRPYAVDVCTGVETDKGSKSADLIHEFVQVVHAADHGDG